MSKVARDIMTEGVITVEKKTSLNDLVTLFLENKISCAPVIDTKNAIIGIVTKTDIVGHFLDIDLEISVKVMLQDALEHYTEHPQTEITTAAELDVGSIMTRNPLTADVNTPIDELANNMIDHNIHRLIITENGEICGIISTLDILYHVSGREKNE